MISLPSNSDSICKCMEQMEMNILYAFKLNGREHKKEITIVNFQFHSTYKYAHSTASFFVLVCPLFSQPFNLLMREIDSRGIFCLFWIIATFIWIICCFDIRKRLRSAMAKSYTIKVTQSSNSAEFFGINIWFVRAIFCLHVFFPCLYCSS